MTNRYRVPLRQWNKWNATARRVFNEVFGTMSKNQWVFLHPKQDTLSALHWRTVAWNAAWLAADAVLDATPCTGDVIQDVGPRGVVRSRRVA